MSYQVLARKYRPASFSELEGQEHVQRALVNALDNDRLHHAYLFTGTRGVGKTTIARILARCLNCETGVSSTPCGTCSTCLEIAEGRCVDLLEVDAASRTRVEDTRELLDNVQYMPTRARYKIYLIDEVHMLSTHSFNALLKTLEEPPDHVKFLLATTDPKKLPITVLSRCLQFNLKNLSPERVVNQLKKVLPIEEVAFDEPSLWLLGRAADGSMRDALSLTDQAISFGNGSINEADVRSMLGSIDQREVYELLNHLVSQNGSALLHKVRDLAEFAPDYVGLLGEMQSVLHRVAVAQAVPESIDNSEGDQALVEALAQTISPEDTQLFYQIAMMGRKDLDFAPDLRTGFEMVLLQMLAFTPLAAGDGPVPTGASPEKKSLELANRLDAALRASAHDRAPAERNASPDQAADDASAVELTQDKLPELSRVAADGAGLVPAAGPASGKNMGLANEPRSAPVPGSEVGQMRGAAGVQTAPVALVRAAKAPMPGRETRTSPAPKAVADSGAAPFPKAETETRIELVDDGKTSEVAGDAGIDDLPGQVDDWVAMLPSLGLTGVTQTVAANCSLNTISTESMKLLLDNQHSSLLNVTHQARIEQAVQRHRGANWRVQIEVGENLGTTPAQVEATRRRLAYENAVEVIQNDAKVQELIESFDGHLDKDTITAKQD